MRLVGEASYRRYLSGTGPSRNCKTSSSVPIKGELARLLVRNVDLPPELVPPIPITSLSKRVRKLCENFEELMLSGSREEKRAAADFTPFQDPALSEDGQAAALAARMWKSCMLREVRASDVVDEVALFSVVKKILDDGTVILRLIIDSRMANYTWRDAPWIAMSGPGAFSSLSFGLAIREGGEFFAAAGDIPHYFYRLELPPNYFFKIFNRSKQH